MAVALVQISGSKGAFAGGNTATPGALAAGATANNLLVAPYGHQQYDFDTAAVTAPGFSPANSVIASDVTLAGCLYKIAAGAETGATFTNTTAGLPANSFGDVIIAEFSGLDAIAPYVAGDSNDGEGSGITSLTVSSANPLSENAGVAIASFASDQSMVGGSWPPAGWNSLVDDLGGDQIAIAYLIFSSNAQLTAAISSISAAGNIAATVTIFKAATSSSAFRKTLSSVGGRIGTRQLQS